MKTADEMPTGVNSHKPHWPMALLRVGLAVIIIAWVVWRLDWVALAESFRRIRLVWVAAATFSFMLSLALKLVRWRWLLADLLPQANWVTLARALFLGQAVNIIGLGRFGEVARVVSLRHDGAISGVGAATSVVAEKLLDLAYLGLAAGWWLLLLLTPRGVNVFQFLLVGAASLLSLALCGWFGQTALRWLQSYLARWNVPAGRWLAPRVAAIAKGLKGLIQRRQLEQGLLMTAVIWGVMLLTNLLLLLAFDLPFSGRLGLSVLVLGLLGVAANLTPANIGPEHGAIMLALTLFQVRPSTALAYALVLHAIVTILPLVIAMALNGWRWAELRAIADRPEKPELVL